MEALNQRMHFAIFIESLHHDSFLDVMSILRALELTSSKIRNINKDITFKYDSPAMDLLIMDVTIGDDSFWKDDDCSSCYFSQGSCISKHVSFLTKVEMAKGLRAL